MSDTTECKLSAENDGTLGERDASVKTGWQPIETAPKDGTTIDLWAIRQTTGKAGRYPDCRWGWRHFGSEPFGDPVWLGIQDPYSIIAPTHWMPLPLPPEPTP